MDKNTCTTTKSVHLKSLLIIGAAGLHVGLSISVLYEYMLAADR